MKPYKPIYDTDYGDDLSTVQAHQLASDGLVHYATIGYFLQWFAAVEQGVDFLLMWAARMSDPVTYETIIRGLPPRNKCERLRAICKASKVKLGPRLDERLLYFSSRVCDVRNRIAHSFMVHGDNTDWIEFFTIAEAKGPRARTLPRARYRLHSLELFEHGYWLKTLAVDLQRELLRPSPHLKTLEIAAPSSRLPRAQNPGSPPKVSRAKPGKPAQKRAAKKPPKKPPPKKKG